MTEPANQTEASVQAHSSEQAPSGDGVVVPEEQVSTRLWERDTGTLRSASRTVLAALIKGPYVSAKRHPKNWRALLADTDEIRSRLADMFLDLVIDDERGVAFVRNAETYDEDAPQVVRTSPLTLMDTAMLLQLRRELVSATGGGRVIVGREEVYEHLQAYRSQVSTDDAGFAKRINASWNKMDGLGILQRTATSHVDGRFEISPVLRLIFGPEQIQAVREEYARLRGEQTDEATNDDDVDRVRAVGQTEDQTETDDQDDQTEPEQFHEGGAA